jgi:hypothetical protein
MVSVYNSSNWAAKSEAGGSQVGGQPGLPGKILSQNSNENKKQYWEKIDLYICSM